MKKSYITTLFLLLLLILIPDSRISAVLKITGITLTDEVIIKDCSPFGINLGGDNYYSGSVLVKKRASMNFEGTSYRQTPCGPAMGEQGLITWFGVTEEWQNILRGAKYTILSGPDKGMTGTLKGIGTIDYKDKKSKRKLKYWKFDKKVKPFEGKCGILVESYRLNDGQFRRIDGHWTTKDNCIHTGDVPPGSFGNACLNLNGSKDKAHVRFATCYQRYMDTNGTWHIRFWTKTRSGSPRLKVLCTRKEYGEIRPIESLPVKWTRQEIILRVDKVPEPETAKDNPHLTFLIEAEGGEVLLDDVEIWKEEGENPTVFRDDLIATLRKFGPGGPLRKLQMGGNTLKNCLMPPLKAHSFSSRVSTKIGPYTKHTTSPYSLHEFYELCEHAGFEPWYCLPGTLHRKEAEQFMEYLSAPADTGFGRIRAELGHPRPWTETLKRIHVEFGNEAWNNATPYKIGGYNGPDYWKDLIQAGKSSPYYRKNVIFHSAGQAANGRMSDRIMQETPNADRYSVAPYIIQSLTEKEIKLLDSNDKLFRWVFAWPLWRARNENGAMYQNSVSSRKHNIELSVYEINHHITKGSDTLEERNRIVTSLGGGLNVINTMLVNLKEHRARSQSFFTLIKHSYDAKDIGPVRLWGAALNMRKGYERFRPTFLACSLCNRIISGDLVKTEHSGSNPVFEAAGIFYKRDNIKTIKNLPLIFSYGFMDGKYRGLIIVNLDTKYERTVNINFKGTVKNEKAHSYLMWSDDIADNNEFENPTPKVIIREKEILNFKSGKTIAIPRHSLFALKWELR